MNVVKIQTMGPAVQLVDALRHQTGGYGFDSW
jgi:hypothetical protein